MTTPRLGPARRGHPSPPSPTPIRRRSTPVPTTRSGSTPTTRSGPVTSIPVPTTQQSDRIDIGLRLAYRHKREAKSAYLTAAMVAAGLNRTQLARVMGVNLSYISRIMGGWRTPSLDTTLRLADALDLDLRELAYHLVGPAYDIHRSSGAGQSPLPVTPDHSPSPTTTHGHPHD